jgi:ribosomal RNA-processing protein 36
MSSLKRKNTSSLLDRRVRPRKDEDTDIEEVDDYSDDGSSAPSEDGVSEGSNASESEEDNARSGDVSLDGLCIMGPH